MDDRINPDSSRHEPATEYPGATELAKAKLAAALNLPTSALVIDDPLTPGAKLAREINARLKFDGGIAKLLANNARQAAGLAPLK